MKANDIWVVTGASGGMGGTLVQKLLAKGHKVAALSRTPEKVPGSGDSFLAIKTDITDEGSVLSALDKVIAKFGRYDVVVNAAGYGLRGAVEEISDAEARKLFDVNLFGMMNVCRNFIPGLREQGGGCIINFSSSDAIAATPYNALYDATMFAIDALTDAINKEAGQFGIAAICVKSGPIRTKYISHKVQAAQQLGAYDAARAEDAAKDKALQGNEPADPEKIAELLIELSAQAAPPTNLYLTQKSVEAARAKWDFLENEFDEWKWASFSVDFPKEECYYGKRS